MTDISLLSSALIRCVGHDGHTFGSTLPGLMAALVRDEVASLPAVQAHQRHAFHATLVQIAAIAMHSAGVSVPPDDENSWRVLLEQAVPESHRATAWSLVAPDGAPAFLQPAVASSWKGAVAYDCPRSIDIPVITRNHDLKIGSTSMAGLDDWLAALVSVQTCEGRTDRFHHGVARLNGALGNRVGVGLVPPGGMGTRFVRDIGGHLHHRAAATEKMGYVQEGGIAFLWLEPWDTDEELPLASMDPFFVESCRRIRIGIAENGRAFARIWQNMASRVAAKAFNGDVGDLWMPRVLEGAASKSFSGDQNGFGYKRMTTLLFGDTGEARSTEPSPLTLSLPGDPRAGMTFQARMLVRGKGKTIGYHERTVPVAKAYAGLLGRPEGEPYGLMAKDMVKSAGGVTGILVYALRKLATGSDVHRPGDKTATAKAALWSAGMARRVDAAFFDRLAQFGGRIAGGTPPEACLVEWEVELYRMALDTLRDAQAVAGGKVIRRGAAIARSESALRGLFRHKYRSAWDILHPPGSEEEEKARVDAEALAGAEVPEGTDTEEREEEDA